MKLTKEKVKAWRNGAAGFLQWLDDVKPRVPSRKGGFVVFEPEPYQVEAVRGALQMDNGLFRYQTLLLSMPRRHGKTILAALLVLWRFTTRQTENIVVMANTERQTLSVGFKLLKSITTNTPALLAMVGPKNLGASQITYPALQSLIQAVPASEAGLYGQKLTAGWVSELHAAASDAALQILASSLGDSENSWLLVDTTCGPIGGPDHRLEQLAESGEDPTIFCFTRSYADLEDALQNSPSWLSRSWLKSRKAQLLPAVFASQHLNHRSQAQNSLFKAEDLEACRDSYVAPVERGSLGGLFNGRKCVCGGGLDRALSFSLHGDATIWTTCAKVAGEDGEAEYWVLNQRQIPFSQGRAIKKAIVADHEAYSLHNTVFEQYQSVDLVAWAQDSATPCERVHATSKDQAAVFTELARLVQEKRLHLPRNLEPLEKELKAFKYEIGPKHPKFGAPKGHHDDRVYSLAWAIWSLRDDELQAYELPRIVCASKSPHSRHCYLRGGDLILMCSEDCQAHQQVNGMHLQYRRSRVDADLSLPEFFKRKVKVSGVRVWQGV